MFFAGLNNSTRAEPVNSTGRWSPLGAQENPQKENDARGDCHGSVDGPPDLAGHEAARQHIDSLEEPYAAHHNQQDGHEPRGNFHFLGCAITLRLAAAREERPRRSSMPAVKNGPRARSLTHATIFSCPRHVVYFGGAMPSSAGCT